MISSILKLKTHLLSHLTVISIFSFFTFGTPLDQINIKSTSAINPRYLDIISQKIDSIGSDWEDSASSFKINDFIVQSNGNKIFTGTLYFNDKRLINGFIIKMDNKDDIIWAQIDKGDNIIVPQKIYDFNSKFLLIIGYYTDIEGKKYSQVTSDIFIQKYSRDGRKIWERKFGEKNYNEEPLAGKKLSDSSFLIIGIQQDLDKYLYLVRINSAGKLLWDHRETIEGELSNIDVKENRDHLIISGNTIQYTDSPGNYKQDPFVLKMDNSGSSLSYQYSNSGAPDKDKISASDDNLNKYDGPRTLDDMTMALITGTDVIVRNEPSINSRVLAVLNKNDSCQVINRSNNKDKIGNRRNYWYKLKFNNTVGWVYGDFIQFE
jgi:hypothetical protein